MTDLKKAKLLLQKGGYTCVLQKDEQVFTSELRGVKPLVIWLESNTDFAGFSAADKVVGKGAAFLYALMGIECLYANVISKSALQVLKKYNIKAGYGILAENIVNRRGDGICPFEEAVLDTEEKEEALLLIKAKMQELNIS